MRSILTLAVVFGALALGCGVAAAQALGGETLVGRTKVAPGCPAVGLHIIREGGQLSGVVFNLDGTGVSKVQGSVQGNSFTWHDTVMSGNGPTGNVSGTVSPQGFLKSAKAGTPCTFDTLLPMQNDTSGGGNN